MSITRYVLGFLFDPPPYHRVVLIRKKRPNWQAGFLNGVGGHLEESDKDIWAGMEREFHEETGVRKDNWIHYATMDFFERRLLTSVVYVFAAEDKHRVEQVRSNTDEEIKLYAVDLLSWDNPLPNLKWLVPMGISALEHTVTADWPLKISYPL